MSWPDPIPVPDTAPLRHFFHPRGVAVIGASATPGKLGYGVLHNLLRHGYAGAVYPVNPGATEMLGLPCYPDIAAVPDPVDLAVLIIPAAAAVTALRGCGERGIRAAAILSGGFAESGAEGAQRQQELLQIARSFDMRLIGPNCVGVLDAYSRLNATFIEQMPSPGVIAFLSQSGAMGGALIDWAKGQGIGLSHFASLGNTVDVDEADLIAYLAADEHAGAIALYIEGLNDGRRFMQMAAAASRRKPILALKAGGTAAGARAVASHTAHLAGSAQGYAAAFRQSGVIQVHTAAELFAAALGLAYQPPPAGDNVAILTNAGGPGALAADALARAGLAAPEPDAATRSALRAALGPAAQLANPIDMLGAASTPEYEAAGRVLLASPTYDALLVLLVPNTVTDPVGIADALQRLQAEQSVRKPIFVCAMGGISIAAGMRRLHRHRIPPFAFPETAARALAAARGWQRWRLSPPESPLPSPPALPAAVQQALQAHLQGGRAALGESDLIHLLQPLGFPFPPGCLAATPAAAAACAGQIGRPVALKIVSPDLLHKSDAGGVRLHVAPAAAAEACADLLAAVARQRPQARIHGVLVQAMAPPGLEVIVGMRRDPTFGPLILFGGGGIYVEALADVAVRVAPVSRAQAAAMIEETVVGGLLAGARGRPPADIPALADLILRVSDLACAAPELAEFELNPVLAHPAGEGVTAVDARAVLG